jgi:hypothetical protein
MFVLQFVCSWKHGNKNHLVLGPQVLTNEGLKRVEVKETGARVHVRYKNQYLSKDLKDKCYFHLGP